MNPTKNLVVLAVLSSLVAGCSGGNASSGLPSTATTSTQPGSMHGSDTLGGVGNSPTIANSSMTVMLGDALPVFGGMTATAINLGIDSVAVNYGGVSYPIASYSSPLVVNVMANQGTPSSIGIGSVYDENYTSISFTVDTASSNVVDSNGNVHPIQFLTNDSNQSSAGAGASTTTTGNGSSVTMTVAGNFSIAGNPASLVQADFNALESLNADSSGNVTARPTLFAVPTALAGKAAGTIVNQSGAPVAGAVVVLKCDGVVQNSDVTDANGNFNLHSVAAGTYNLWVYNSYTTASGQSLTANGNSNQQNHFRSERVTIQAGEITNVGTIAD